jgi:hypothetical protein
MRCQVVPACWTKSKGKRREVSKMLDIPDQRVQYGLQNFKRKHNGAFDNISRVKPSIWCLNTIKRVLESFRAPDGILTERRGNGYCL